MDAAYFGLTRNPFERDPEIDEASLPPSRIDLLRELLAVEHGSGAVGVVVGDAGVGKSALATALAARIGRDRPVAFVSAASADLEWLIGEILAQLAATPGYRERMRPPGDASGTPPPHDRVVIVDEADRLALEELEELVRTRVGRLFLFGRAPLLETVARLADHATIRAYRLTPLSRGEAAAYLEDRIAAAGGSVSALFSEAARRRLVEATHGLTSVLESVAARTLRDARGPEATPVDVDTVAGILRRAEAPRGDDRPPLPPPPRPPAERSADEEEPESTDAEEAAESRRAVRWLVGSILGLGALVAGWFALPTPSGRPAANTPAPPPMHAPVAPPVGGSAPAPVSPAPSASPPRHDPGPVPSDPRSAPAPGAPVPSPEWVVQVGVFRSERNAREALGALRSLDPGARIRERRGLFFVLSGAVDSERTAQDLERRLQAAGLPTFVRTWNSP